ncbi:hypothetical protein J6590_096230 [Homalodisca vitripennis]|nr:hypothetical protein J6590_030530 [Homalodisca vitripennis]KAG8324272.1 hypothetical protein J6590_096230 [Homalodisca vitripennis]
MKYALMSDKTDSVLTSAGRVCAQRHFSTAQPRPFPRLGPEYTVYISFSFINSYPVTNDLPTDDIIHQLSLELTSDCRTNTRTFDTSTGRLSVPLEPRDGK